MKRRKKILGRERDLEGGIEMAILDSLERLAPYFEDEPPLLRSAKTIQILLVRQTHDYTIFRTEETRELNVVSLPHSTRDATSTLKVAMLASKQKAAENRTFSSLCRTLAKEKKIKLSNGQANCHLKDNLCRSCPRCVLFGAVSTAGGARGQGRWNIRHRIEYSTSYSLEPYEEVYELITFNAVSDQTQSTGQALGYTENVQPLVHFPSVITLNSATERELIMVLKTLLACRSYGAETRTKGDMVNHVVGIAAGWEELLTSLEFSLELASEDVDHAVAATERILKKYQSLASFASKVTILKSNDVKRLVQEVSGFSPNKGFVSKLYEDASKFEQKATKVAKKESGKGGRKGGGR